MKPSSKFKALYVVCVVASFGTQSILAFAGDNKESRKRFVRDRVQDRFRNLAESEVFSSAPFEALSSARQISAGPRNLRVKFNRRSLLKVLNVMPEEMRLKVKTVDGDKVLSLIRKDITAPNLKVYTTQGLYQNDSSKVATYQGIVDSHPDNSLVSLTFSADENEKPEVTGVIEYGSKRFQLGGEVYKEVEDETVVTDVNSLPMQNDKTCALDELASESLVINKSLTAGSSSNLAAEVQAVVAGAAVGGDPVKIFFEIDNQLYKDKGSSVANVVTYITTIFNRVQSLYANENVNVQIAEIFVWDTLDPYASLTSTSAILPQFANTRGSNHSGDLAHLVTTRSVGGGIAYIASLCNKTFAHAVSGIFKTTGNMEIYDWSAEVITHETGHSLGSKHTHWCGWAGGAIDGCWTPEGTCAKGPMPTTGGTIMSYCHLVYDVGIKFANGFGPLPGGVIRNTVTNAACIKPNYIDKTAPQVWLTSPSYGASLVGDVVVTAGASDNFSAISKVELYAGNKLVASDLTAPYQMVWPTKNSPNGDTTIKLQAFDAAGNKAFSNDTIVTIANGVVDTVAPFVSLSTPYEGSTVSGVVGIYAGASDSFGVTDVRFYVGSTLIGTDTVAPYTLNWDSTSVANGLVSLKVEARDSAGNIGAITRAITISNAYSAPIVTMTSPVNNATVSGNVTVSANVASLLAITKVDFYRGTTLIGTDTTSPYSISWATTGVANGVYAISAKATNSSLMVGTSPNVNANVVNGVVVTPLRFVSVTAGQDNSVTDITKRNWIRVQINPEAASKVLTFAAKASTNVAWTVKAGTSLRKISNEIYDIFLNSPNVSYDVKVGCVSCTPTSIISTIKTLP